MATKIRNFISWKQSNDQNLQNHFPKRNLGQNFAQSRRTSIYLHYWNKNLTTNGTVPLWENYKTEWVDIFQYFNTLRIYLPKLESIYILRTYLTDSQWVSQLDLLYFFLFFPLFLTCFSLTYSSDIYINAQELNSTAFGLTACSRPQLKLY